MLSRWAALVLAAPLLVAAEYQPVKEYDSDRDAAKDIRAALAEASRTHRRVLLDVGGNWCSWCRTLDKFLASHPDLTSFLDKNYVMVKVYSGPDNDNKDALGKYPRPEGYPHVYVLDEKGGLLCSQSTADFEEGSGYSAAKWQAFFEKWAPPPAK